MTLDASAAVTSSELTARGSELSFVLEEAARLAWVPMTSVTTIATSVAGIRHCSYDPGLNGGAGGYWIGGWTDLYAVSLTGTTLYAGGITVNNAYGSAYDDMSTGGPYLWLYTQSGANSQDITQYKINTTAPYLVATGVTHNSGTLPGSAAGTAGGRASCGIPGPARRCSIPRSRASR